MKPNTTAAAATGAAEPVPFAILVLRRLNPLVMRLLRSRLHALLSRDLLVLTCRGRRSGREISLPLSWVENDGRVYLCTRNSAWWRNLAAASEATVWLRGRRVALRPVVLDPDSKEALDGLRAFVTANPTTGVKLYRIRRGPDGRPDETDLAREVRNSVVVRLEPLGG